MPYLDENGNKAYMSTEEYIKLELSKEIDVRDAISERLSDTSENGLIPQFVKKVNELHQKQSEVLADGEQLAERRNANSVEVDIDLSDNNELATRIAGLQGAKKYNTIRDYILESIGGHEFILSDGIKAKVDKSDALHIANKSADKKIAYISKITELIKKATLYSVATNVVHNKFSEFRYYKATVKFGEEIYPLFLNVGKAKNGDGYHLYDITKKIGDFAKHNALERVNKDLRSEIESPKIYYTQDKGKVNEEIVNNEGEQLSDRTTSPTAHDLMGEKERLERRYAKLKVDFEAYKKWVKLDKTLTRGKVMNRSQLEAVARYLVKEGDSTYKVSELMPILNDLYVALQDGALNDNMSWEQMYSRA